MELNFCRRCGKPLTHKVENLYVCPAGHETYDMCASGGAVVLLNGNDEVLITTRGIAPAVGTYCLPGGFCDNEETHKEATIRELQEETGLLPGDYTDLQYLTEAIDHYEYKGEVKTVIAVIFWARITGNTKLRHEDGDISKIEWIPIADIDITNVDPRLKALPLGITEMRRKLGLLA